jgi:uncharacterized glyoxalase superfamily protein PhnB
MSDPLDVLRTPNTPIAPPATFARDLRRRLEIALGRDPGGRSMSVATTTTDAAAAGVPERAHGLQPYIAVRGAERAIAWYQDVFGAVETAERYTDEDGRIGHAELRIGDSMLMLSDEYPDYDAVSPETLGGSPVGLHLYVPDVDEVVARAQRAGATIDRPPSDQSYGDRSSVFRDPFGHRWFVATHIEDVPLEELQRRNEEQGFAVSAPSRAGQLFYFTIGTGDGDRARAFFSQLLGWTMEPGREPGAYHLASLTQPGGLHGGEATPKVDLWFIVDDIDEAVRRVRELGGTAEEPVRYDSGSSVACTDDQGTPFNLSVPAPGY